MTATQDPPADRSPADPSTADRDRRDLYRRIGEFYDESSDLWERVWGEHMHHGYYGPDGTEPKERRQAQIDLIEALLAWAGCDRASQILDAGCGIGGSALYLADKFDAEVEGVTLSPRQARRAEARAVAAGLSDRARFQVADVLALPFADESFDLVWSLESGEHLPDKVQFLRECDRVLKPGGTLLVATWCHRPAPPYGPPLNPLETLHLSALYGVYHLPFVISLPEYAAIARSLGLQNLDTADWSAAVAPFWDAVVESAFDWQVVQGILASGWETARGALALGLMSSGYASGLVRYGLLRSRKPG